MTFPSGDDGPLPQARIDTIPLLILAGIAVAAFFMYAIRP